MLALGLEATAGYGLAQPDIRTGDVALFAALIAGLDLALLAFRLIDPAMLVEIEADAVVPEGR